MSLLNSFHCGHLLFTWKTRRRKTTSPQSGNNIKEKTFFRNDISEKRSIYWSWYDKLFLVAFGCYLKFWYDENYITDFILEWRIEWYFNEFDISYKERKVKKQGPRQDSGSAGDKKVLRPWWITQKWISRKTPQAAKCDSKRDSNTHVFQWILRNYLEQLFL